MFLENMVTIRDQELLKNIVSNVSSEEVFLLRNVFVKVKRFNTELIKINNPVLLINNCAYIFPNTGIINEELILSYLNNLNYNVVTYINHQINEQRTKDFDIVSDEITTDMAMKSCIQRRAYRKCYYKPNENIEIELGYYGSNQGSLIIKNHQGIKVSKQDKYTLLSIMHFTGTVELDNELIITNSTVGLRNVYQACLNSGVDMVIDRLPIRGKEVVFKKV